MIGFRSVLSRITVLHAAAIIVTSVGMPLALEFQLDELTRKTHDRLLAARAKDVADRVSRRDGGWHLDMMPADGNQHFLWSSRHHVFSVVDRDNNVLVSLPRGSAPVLSADPHATRPYFFGDRGAPQLSGGSFPFVIDDVAVWVQVAEYMSHPDELIDDVADQFFAGVSWIVAPILFLLLLIEFVIIRRGLRPVRLASALAAQIGPSRVDLRLPSAGMPQEILPLVNAVNLALERMEKAFRMEREFVADAAHELRTPLAILQMHAETIGDPATSKLLREDIAAMVRLVEQLLDMARLELMVIEPDEIADLHRVCVQVARLVAPLASAQNKRINVTGVSEPVFIHGQSDRMAQAVRNLVDNALRHTPAGSAVDINVTDEPAIHVRDHGSGISPGEIDLIFRRFWRRDRRRADGVGLGLSIVSKIVACHGGVIDVKNADDGGAIFSIRFPPAVAIQMESDGLDDAKEGESAADGQVLVAPEDARPRQTSASSNEG